MNKNPLDQSNTRRIPGYSGYIPGVRSENLHGSTYGKTIKQSEHGGTTKGINQPTGQRFMSTNQANFVDQMTYHDPLDDIVATEGDNEIPVGDNAKFYGEAPTDEDTYNKNAEIFYCGGLASEGFKQPQGETIQQASSKFFDQPGQETQNQYDWETLPLSYEEAKARAYAS